MERGKIFIGAAWPYANGSLHLGHVAGLIGADIIARWHRLNGNEVLYVSGSDCHGTPIAVEAEKRGVEPSRISETYHKEFLETLVKGLNFSYDIFTKTTTQNHKKIVQDMFLKLYDNGHIYTKTEKLPFCQQCRRFLPDRYVEGECPVCRFKNARGDQCDECGSLLDSNQLKNPKCKICASKPEWRDSEHFYLKLSSFQEELKKFVEKSRGWRANAKNFTLNMLKKEGLHDRAITRDTEWGVEIPIKGYENKRIYVWFEAVCGYLTASVEWAKNQGDENLWKKFWQNEKALHYYVHGKDNIPFHSLIWPAILLGYGGLKLPDLIISSEYLTFEKQQFSKSRGWGIWLPDFLSSFKAETLRYYLVINGPETSDSDFSWLEFQAKINNELIGNFGNLVHRTFSMISNHFPDGADFPQEPDEKAKKILEIAKESFDSVGKKIEDGHFREAIKIIFKLVELGNKFINEKSPWEKIKIDRAGTENDLAVIAHVIKCLGILIAPFLPQTSENILNIINLEKNNLRWEYPQPQKIIIKNLKPLYEKIEDDRIETQLSKLEK